MAAQVTDTSDDRPGALSAKVMDTSDDRTGVGVAVWEALRRQPLRYLVSLWPWRSWAFLLTGVLFGVAVALSLAVLVTLGVLTSLIGIGLLLLTLVVLMGLPVAAVERRRLRLVEPAPPRDPHGPLVGAGPWAWLRARLAERATWRELGYAALHAVVFTGAGFGVLVLLALSGIVASAPLIVGINERETVMILPGQPITDPLAAVPFCFLGLAGLALSAYLAGFLAGAQVRVASFLLAPREEKTAERVIELTRSRARLADAFEAERRRIERDLHDGAQQQLVALTMTLGLAELELRHNGPDAAHLVSRGRGEARRALDQLRDLVRGIHPQVLTDHGLAPAVAEVALRNPVPVTVDIDLPHRLPGAVETMAYFTVTEALANVNKHSGAARVTVRGRLQGDLLTLTVTDDGRGGADPARGTGLTGLADRVAILQGRLVVSSPVGGPTRLRAEVPCSA